MNAISRDPPDVDDATGDLWPWGINTGCRNELQELWVVISKWSSIVPSDQAPARLSSWGYYVECDDLTMIFYEMITWSSRTTTTIEEYNSPFFLLKQIAALLPRDLYKELQKDNWSWLSRETVAGSWRRGKNMIITFLDIVIIMLTVAVSNITEKPMMIMTSGHWPLWPWSRP